LQAQIAVALTLVAMLVIASTLITLDKINTGTNTIDPPTTLANIGNVTYSATYQSNNAINKIAFVQPTFTYAAYQLHGFYNFYAKYLHVPDGVNVTTDLNLFTVKIPHGPFLLHNQQLSDVPHIPQKEYLDTTFSHVKNNAPASIIANITDKDVHDGKIFMQNSSNAYSVLFLFHAEYATQAEYNNFKKFVENGGTIVFNDANIFTTEVRYNNANDTITLVRGHTWQYNGQSAWRVERERWGNETQQWVGSNFLDAPTTDKLTFINNPFNYTHTEEQYVSNQNDKIILDFGLQDADHKVDAKDPSDGDVNHSKVAVYELQHGHGRVVMLGIFGHTLLNNKNFFEFYDKEIIPRALNDTIISATITKTGM